MEKNLHPPCLGQTNVCLSSLGKHGLSYELKSCPGEVEKISSPLQVHQQLTCIATLGPQSESSSIDH
eukprot:7472553-Prorocentrum_lima.AAC.1